MQAPIWSIKFTPKDDDWKLNLTAAPRYPLVKYVKGNSRNLNTTFYKWYATLDRRMELWKQFYGRVPDRQSWVYKYYKNYWNVPIFSVKI